MKCTYLIVLIFTLPGGCNSPVKKLNTVQSPGHSSAKNDSFFLNLFTKKDATIILGQTAYCTNHSKSCRKGVVVYNFTYTSDAKDSAGIIYFVVEQYEEQAEAHRVYSFISKANAHHDGITQLNHFGDEAYFHTDHESFYFIMARKGTRMFRIKLSKITSKTTLEQFNKTAKKITNTL